MKCDEKCDAAKYSSHSWKLETFYTDRREYLAVYLKHKEPGKVLASKNDRREKNERQRKPSVKRVSMGESGEET